MFKQIIFGISCITLALSVIWVYKTGWDWEPLICLGGSIIGVISTMNFGIRSEQLIGTWKANFDSPQLFYEEVTLYGESGKFASVAKVHPVIYMQFKAKLHLCISGFYNVKDDKIYYTLEKVDIIHHESLPYETIQIILAKVHEQKPVEILSFEKNKKVTKSENGTTTTSIRISDKVDVEYFEKFAEEK